MSSYYAMPLILVLLCLGYTIYKRYGASLEKGYCIESRSINGFYHATFEYEIEIGGKVEKYTGKAVDSPLSPKEGREYRLLVKKNNPKKITVYRTFIFQVCFLLLLMCCVLGANFY